MTISILKIFRSILSH